MAGCGRSGEIPATTRSSVTHTMSMGKRIPFIQNIASLGLSNTNHMPRFSPSESRPPSPNRRDSGVSTTSETNTASLMTILASPMPRGAGVAVGVGEGVVGCGVGSGVGVGVGASVAIGVAVGVGVAGRGSVGDGGGVCAVVGDNVAVGVVVLVAVAGGRDGGRVGMGVRVEVGEGVGVCVRDIVLVGVGVAGGGDGCEVGVEVRAIVAMGVTVGESAGSSVQADDVASSKANAASVAKRPRASRLRKGRNACQGLRGREHGGRSVLLVRAMDYCNRGTTSFRKVLNCSIGLKEAKRTITVVAPARAYALIDLASCSEGPQGPQRSRHILMP